METIYNDAAHSVFRSLFQFVSRLVVAVEVDVLGWKIHGSGDSQLTAGYHVQPESLGGEYGSQSRVDECLTGIDNQYPGIVFAELSLEFGTLTTQGEFIEDISGGEKSTENI